MATLFVVTIGVKVKVCRLFKVDWTVGIAWTNSGPCDWYKGRENECLEVAPTLRLHFLRVSKSGSFLGSNYELHIGMW